MRIRLPHIHWFTRRNAWLMGHYGDDARPACRCGAVRGER